MCTICDWNCDWFSLCIFHAVPQPVWELWYYNVWCGKYTFSVGLSVCVFVCVCVPDHQGHGEFITWTLPYTRIHNFIYQLCCSLIDQFWSHDTCITPYYSPFPQTQFTEQCTMIFSHVLLHIIDKQDWWFPTIYYNNLLLKLPSCKLLNVTVPRWCTQHIQRCSTTIGRLWSVFKIHIGSSSQYTPKGAVCLWVAVLAVSIPGRRPAGEGHRCRQTGSQRAQNRCCWRAQSTGKRFCQASVVMAGAQREACVVHIVWRWNVRPTRACVDWGS